MDSGRPVGRGDASDRDTAIDLKSDGAADGASRNDAGPTADASHDASRDAGSVCPPEPPGALALGYNTQAFCLVPTVADIAYSSATSANLYSGMFYDSTPPAASHYAMEGGVLEMSLGGGVATQRQNSEQGKLPYLLAGKGFYAEFSTHLSDNNDDHFPAVWLMPQEHNLAKSDHLSTDPAGYERWMEIDCDEGNFDPGSLSSLINWYGTYPSYQETTWNDYKAGDPLDRTVEHVFGVSYDPVGQMVSYWLDGVNTYQHTTSAIPSIVNTYHYYLIMNAASHNPTNDGGNVPYEMFVRYASAWIK